MSDFKKDLLVELERLVPSMMKLPLQGFEVGELYVEALIRYESSKANLQRAKDHIYNQAKLKADHLKIKISEKQLDVKVNNHPTVVQAFDNYLEARKNFEILKNMSKAIDRKEKMIELAIDHIKLFKGANNKTKREVGNGI